MWLTYKAILRGNRLEWQDTPPAHLTPEHPITVQVTILDETEQMTRNGQSGPQMAAVLEQLATMHAFPEITDPVAWERELRQDRALPEREV